MGGEGREEEGGGPSVRERRRISNGLALGAVLAGHVAPGCGVGGREGARCFVCPGSPAAVTRRETGRRKVNLFTAGGPPGE